MVTQRRRSPRAALVDCSPPLARIHERIFAALDLTVSDDGSVGKPGGSCLFVSDPGALNEVELFALPYLGSEWLSKLDDGKSSVAKAQETWRRFEQAEAVCYQTNQSLKRNWGISPYRREITLARKLISRVLGKFDWDPAARCFGWGPGATTRLTRRESDAAYKYCGTPQATIGNAVLANVAIRFNPAWERSLPLVSPDKGLGYVEIVAGNRIVTVPKNYKTDRTIAIEPCMNGYIQKGLGGVIRAKLRGIGVNLDDQSRNQRLALVGSLAGSLATIDLSMASDTISRSVVELLVRPDWLEALGQCRSPFGVLPSGEKIFYQKFSSMGNGYTFELETLIFWALAMAWARIHGEESDRICVYGDDIIVPSTMASEFCGLLGFLGFTPNGKKSYWTGKFRESCGKHYFNGYDVTPFYVKRAPKTLIDLFKIHNQIRRFVNRATWLNPKRSKRLMEVCTWLRSYSPASWRRPSIPDGVGDGAFIGTLYDEVHPLSPLELPKKLRGNQWDGSYFRTFVTVPSYDYIDVVGLLPKALVRLERDGDRPEDGRILVSSREPQEVDVHPIKRERYEEYALFIPARMLS